MNNLNSEHGCSFSQIASFKFVAHKFPVSSFRFQGSVLFPFNCGWRLGADVIADAIDAFDFVDNPAGDGFHYFVGQLVPVGSHTIAAFDGADGDNIFVGAVIAHHADGLDRQEDGACDFQIYDNPDIVD